MLGLRIMHCLPARFPLVSLVASLLVVDVASGQVLDTQKVLEQQKVQALEDALAHGDYERTGDAAQYVILQGAKSPEFHRLLVRALMLQGQAGEALKACDAALKAHLDDLPVLLLRHEILSETGRKDEAAQALQAINDAARKKPVKDRTALELVTLGKAATAAGADPQKVIQNYFSTAKRKDAKSELPYLAIGELSLKHSDYAKAATEFRAGLKAHGESADLHFGLARAFAPTDRQKSLEEIEKTLEMNKFHVGAQVLKAEHFIGAEKFEEADGVLYSATNTNPACAEAWALRSVAATLGSNDLAKAAEHRAKALEPWAQNPLVDHVIGKCFSHAYRFAEGAQQQREVLALDANYLPAKLQLAHDLMRLGQTDEAWKLAAEVREADAYNTQAHNLGLLEKEMDAYRNEQQPDFIMRMTDRDWQTYGPHALALLRQAKAVLAPKYGHVFDKPTRVEFFPSQQDFAIRTFGSLGGQGLLGVCFGTVITMNSPGSLAHGRNNWESTLWHEFCHVVTLSVTNNRMPRWLSEGISVYEEAEHDPSWGMQMNATYRKMILEDDALTPLGQMSSAFMKAGSNDAMLFAYYESSMAVRWMIANYGWDHFRALLGDLATGIRINQALEKNIGPIEKIEPAFSEFMVGQAKAYASKADWAEVEGDKDEFAKAHPNHLTVLRQQAGAAIEAKDWEKVLGIGDQLIELEPENTTAQSGWWIKARALHQLDRLEEETQTLRSLATKSSDAQTAFLRLMQLDQDARQWQALESDASRAFALTPFLPQVSEALALACESQGKNPQAIEHYERLLTLQPSNPAKVRYKLATLLKPADAKRAKRHVLEALVLAPRYRDAQKLLLELP